MGLLDPLRRLFASGDETGGGREEGGDGGVERTATATIGDRVPESLDAVEFGPVARSYIETGEPPAAAPDPERDGRVSVLVTSSREPDPEGLVDTDDIEARVGTLGGEVEHAHGGGTVSAWLPTDALEEFAGGSNIARVEVTIPDDGGVREDPAFEA